MGKIFDILSDSQNAYRKQFEETQALVGKWEKTGLLEGLDNEYERHGTAILLENQARQLIDEVSSTGGRNQEEWSGVALPLVRRIFAEIAAKEFVSVQPMNLPSGLVFYLDFKYGTGQPGFTTGAGATSQECSDISQASLNVLKLETCLPYWDENTASPNGINLNSKFGICIEQFKKD